MSGASSSSSTSPLFVGIDIGGSHIGLNLINSKGNSLAFSSHCIDGSSISSSELLQTILIEIAHNFYQISPSEFHSSSQYKSENNFQQFLNFCLTSSTLPELTKRFSSLVVSLGQLKGVGIACPGQCKDGIIVACANLPSIKNWSVLKELEQIFGSHCGYSLLNDADAAICAEVWHQDASSPRHYENAVMITLGTGIGYSAILRDELYSGSNSMMEGGHAIVYPSFLSTPANPSRACGCGQVGCIEAYGSAKNACLRLSELDAKERGEELKIIDGREMMERFGHNDFNAVEVLEETAKYLAIFCINILRFMDPQVIIFGGGLSKAGEPFLSLIRKYLKTFTWTVLPTEVDIIQARFDDAGALGAALSAAKAYEKAFYPSSAPAPHKGTASSLLSIFTPPEDDSNVFLGPFLVYNSSLPAFLATSSVAFLVYKLVNRLFNERN